MKIPLASLFSTALALSLIAEEPATDPFGDEEFTGSQSPAQRRTLKIEDIQSLIGFFALKYKDEKASLKSKTFNPQDIHTLGATTGVHRVLWEENDSLHAIQYYVKEGETLWRYGFKFTLSPPIWEPHLDTFGKAFEGRKLTQYFIWRVNDSAEPSLESNLEEILIETNTDETKVDDSTENP